jgi:iron complex outermembrane receptor protein
VSRRGRAALATALVLGARARAWADADVTAPPPRTFETVVTAPSAPSATPRADRTASATVVLPGDSPRAYDDLGTLMLEVPGVTTVRTGSLGSVTLLSLRGSNPDQVRYVVDGVPIAIAEGGAVDVSTLPLGDVERVEVYRGQAPLGFGESAMGGIISITTRTPGTPRLAARAGVGSFGARFGDASAGGRLGRLRLYLGVHGLTSVGDFPYANDNGTPLNPADDSLTARTNNDVAQVDGTLRAVLDLPGRRTLSLGVIAFGRDQGLTGQHFVPTPSVRFSTARALAYLRYDSRDDLGEGGRFGAQLFASVQRDHYTDPGYLSPGQVATRDLTQQAGALAEGSRSLASWLRLGAVGGARAETFRPENELDAMPVGAPARRLAAVAGVEATLHFERIDLDVIPSARFEVVSDVVTGRDRLSGEPLPAAPPITRSLPVARLGALRPLGAHATLKANVGRYARVPSFLELYAGQERLLGNPDLRPERGTNADVALEIDGGQRVQVLARTALFGALATDLIEWQHDSYGHARPDNVGAARVLGVEEEVRLVFGSWGRLIAQGTFLDARDTSDSAAHNGRQLPLRPRWQAYVRPELVRLPLERGGGADRVFLGAYVDGALLADSFDDPANLRRTPTEWLVGAGLSAEAPRWGLRATCSAQNLTNAPAWQMAYSAVPGRTIFLSLAWQSALDNQGATAKPN